MQTPRQYYGLISLCPHQRLHELGAVHIHPNTVHEEHKIVPHYTFASCYGVYCAGKICFFPGQLFGICQKQKAFLAAKYLPSLLVFYCMNSQILLRLIKEKEKMEGTLVMMFFANVVLSCRVTYFFR